MEWLKTILETDRELFLFLNGFHNNFMDYFMSVISQIGIWFPFYATIIVFIFKTYKRKGFLILIFVVILILLSDNFSVIIKESVQRLRPNQDPQLKSLVHTVFENGSLYGFVSSHASNTFAVFTFSSFVLRNHRYSYTLLIWATLVSYSRIYLGVHFPLDILGGIILGCFTGWLVFKTMILVENHFSTGRFLKIPESGIKDKYALIIAAAFFLTIIVIAIYALYCTNLL